MGKYLAHIGMGYCLEQKAEETTRGTIILPPVLVKRAPIMTDKTNTNDHK